MLRQIYLLISKMPNINTNKTADGICFIDLENNKYEI